MTDAELMSLWSALEPTARRRARIETRVFDWLEATQTSLAGEWLSLLKIAPIAVVAYVPVGVAALVLLTPIGWITGWLLP